MSARGRLFDEVANYITKLRGLKLYARGFKRRKQNRLQIIPQNYVVWNLFTIKSLSFIPCCKLYHKTTWFETDEIAFNFLDLLKVANYITKLHGLKPAGCSFCSFLVIVANYITKLCGLKRERAKLLSARIIVTNYITKLRGLKL